MLSFAISIFLIFLLLLVSELWFRTHETHGELSRKFIHITVGSFVAFWPYFLSWNQILLLSGAFFVVVIISKTFHIFKGIHSVQRPTYGEVCFALAVGTIALVTHDRAIYVVALLQMSLADGLAAVFGVRYGKKYRYQVLGSVKSVPGTLVFFIVSFALLQLFAMYTNSLLPPAFFVALAVAASLLENLGVWGLDNLLVPLAVAFVLSR